MNADKLNACLLKHFSIRQENIARILVDGNHIEVQMWPVHMYLRFRVCEENGAYSPESPEYGFTDTHPDPEQFFRAYVRTVAEHDTQTKIIRRLRTRNMRLRTATRKLRARIAK